MGKKQRRDAKIRHQQELVEKAKAEGRELTAEEQRSFDEDQREIDRLGAEIEAEENEPENQQRAIEEERARIRTISQVCAWAGVSPDSYIESGASVESVRAAVMDQMIQSSTPVSARSVASVTDEQDKFRAAASDAMLMRSGIELEHPAEGARELIGMSLRDLAIESLNAEGQNGLNRRSSEEIYNLALRQFYNPTAAFPAILDQAINKAYVEGHKTVAVTFDKWTKKGSLKDFKTADNNYLAGPAGEFLEVPEGGELKNDVPTDKKRPTRKLKTYGRQFSLTRQAFINDDIDLVTRIPGKYAAAARKTINKQCYQILINNSAIYDGTPLFSKEHGNLVTTGTGITQDSVQKMILALQNQTDEFGEATIVRPATLVVPAGMAFDVYTLFNSPTINTEGNTQAVNPLFRYASSIEVVEDPTINVLRGGFGQTMPWFLLGSKDDTDFIEVDYLNGQEIPNIRRMEAPGTLGFIWDIYLDWGINVMDFRGAVKNPGVTLANPLD